MEKRSRPPDLLSANSLFLTISSRFVMKIKLKFSRLYKVKYYKNHCANRRVVWACKFWKQKVYLCLFLYVCWLGVFVSILFCTGDFYFGTRWWKRSESRTRSICVIFILHQRFLFRTRWWKRSESRTRSICVNIFR